MTDSGSEPRQRVERAGGGARRARLTPAPGSDPSPEQAVPGSHDESEAPTPRQRPRGQRGKKQASGASSDDERITRERPPHW